MIWLILKNCIVKTSEYYNKIYLKSDEYRKHYTNSIYYPLYKKVFKHISKDDNILELGCGSGQFAHYLYDNYIRDYLGLDFSEEAIKQANKRVEQVFVRHDIIGNDFFSKYDTIIAIEFFEHVEYKEVLKKLEKGSKIIFSVPNFLIDSHLYSWENTDQIEHYFGKYIEIEKIEKGLEIKDKYWFVVKGVIKN
jgi:2-polyprenyl-6-hydroxyphenyl methylase/3-demethylubiquinone-9 3-methyltransferase